MKEIYKNYKPYVKLLPILIILLFLQAMTDLALPDYMSKIINSGIAEKNIPYIYEKGIVMILLAIASVACAGMVSFIAANIAAKSARNIRNSVFEKVTLFSNPEFNLFSTSSLITRSTNDIQQIQMVSVMMMRMVLLAPIMGVGAIIMAYKKSPSITWTIALAVIFILAIIIVVFRITIPKFKMAQKLVDRLNLVVNERLSGLMVIRAFNAGNHEEKRFDMVNEELTQLNLSINKIMFFLMPAMMLIMNGISVLIVWVASFYIDDGKLLVGDMLAFIQYTMQVIISFLLMSMVFINMPRAMVSAQRIEEVLKAEISIKNPEKSIKNSEKQAKELSEEKKGTIEFLNVSFKYPGAEEDVLSNVSFLANPGETTAIIGSTGSGKSTLVNLIPRFYDAFSGSVSVDGIDVKNMNLKELRKKIGYVPQKGILFSGTIESNLKYADDSADSQRLDEAAEIAQAIDFIKDNPNQYELPISQGGTNVSGGQKQRLSIARALVGKPQFYIFDDSFSALDFKTDSALRKALKKELGNSTIIIVAQRISTIKNAEQIIVLDEGSVVGKGTHKDLMENCEVYREIAYSQLPKEVQ